MYKKLTANFKNPKHYIFRLIRIYWAANIQTLSFLTKKLNIYFMCSRDVFFHIKCG